MKPNRPDSAKSTRTKITVDSQHSSKDLTASKFSETYSNGVKPNNDRNLDFDKYVAEKNKDPKFKKYGNSRLENIPEHTKPSAQLSKLTSKPFEKKSSKIDKEKTEKKTQEPSKVEAPQKEMKKQNFQSSQTFMDKSKRKLKVTSKQQLEGKNENGKNLNGSQVSQASCVSEQQEKWAKPNPNINFNGFVKNVPGKKPQVINEKKKENVEQTEQQRQRKERERVMTELSQYVQQIETRNEDYLPNRYNAFVERSLEDSGVDLQKINIQDFCSQPNDMDYDRLMKKINENELRLEQGQRPNSKMQNSSLSINLEQIIDGEVAQVHEDEQDKQSKLAQSFVALSSMSASDVKDRNTFLTQILKGRINSNQIQEIKKQDEVRVKLIKLQGLDKEDQLDQEEVQMVEINMNKKKNNKILERNKYEAAGELYRQCDYLSAEQQKRIDDILNGAQIESPFEFSQMESFMNRRIDEGIKLHRDLCRNVQGLNTEQQNIEIDLQTLPKDPILRKNAELKILKQKINSINARLTGLNNGTISQPKVRSLINKLKQNIKTSKMGERLIQEKRKQFQQQGKQLNEAQKLLKSTEEQGGYILKLIQEMMSQYGSMEAQVLRIQNMDIEQRRKLEKEQLKKKEKSLIEVEQLVKQLEQDQIIIEQQLRNFDEIMSIKIEKPQCQGHNQSETIHDLDLLVTKKWQLAEQAVENLRGSERLLQ